MRNAILFISITAFASVLMPLALRAQPCAPEGTADAIHVHVTPVGGAAFDVIARAMRVVAHPTADPRVTNVDIATGLSFTGVASYVPYVLRGATRDATGILRLTPRAIPTDVRLSERGVVSDVLLAYDVIAHEVVLPCRSIAIGRVRRPLVIPSPRTSALRLIPREPSFIVLADPADTTGLRISGQNLVSFRKLGTRGDFVQVSWDFAAGGGSFRGWLPASVVQMGLPQSTSPSFGDPGPGRGMIVPTSSDRRVYIGSATIDGGTAVFADDQGGGRWATVTSSSSFTVRRDPTKAFAEILMAPGFAEDGGTCGQGLCHAFVPVAAVHPDTGTR